jgi:hypothetical protein
MMVGDSPAIWISTSSVTFGSVRSAPSSLILVLTSSPFSEEWRGGGYIHK